MKPLTALQGDGAPRLARRQRRGPNLGRLPAISDRDDRATVPASRSQVKGTQG